MNRHREIQRDKRNGNYFVWICRQGFRRYFRLGANKRKAEKRLRQIEDEINGGKIQFAEQETTRVVNDGKPDMRIEELIVEYLEWAKTALAKSTYDTRKLYLNDFYDFVGKCMVSSILPITLSKYHTSRRQRLIKKREALMLKHSEKTDNMFSSDNAGNTHLRHVKTLLKWGESMKHCKCSFEKFPPIKESPARLVSPTAEEVERLLARMPQDMRDMAVLEILTGLRPQELLRLKKEDLHRENGQACLVVKPKSENLMRQPKPRVVPLSPIALDIVTRMVNSYPRSPMVFLNEDGEPYTAFSYRQRFQRWCRRAGIKRLTPYALRHFFGTHQAGIGTNNQVLSQIMGHTTTRTLSRYVEPVPEYQQKAVEAHEKNLSHLFMPGLGECKVDAKYATKCATKESDKTEKKQEVVVSP